MKSTQKFLSLLLLFTLVGMMMLSACSAANTVEATIDTTSAETGDAQDEPSADTQESEDSAEVIDAAHSKEADPDYDTVFPQDEVNEITITISEENWAAMMADMEENYGSASSAGFPAQDDGQMGRPGMPENGEAVPPRQGGMPQDGEALPPEMGEMPQDEAGMKPGGGGMDMENSGDDDSNPIWVTATIEFEDETWENVGMRFKGNSSLRDSWNSGGTKLPFKLDFDEFEDEYPEIEDQRFYGFKQLTFSSNFSDSSYLREKVTADIFRDAGVPSAQTAFYAVYLDNGSGSVEYMGLYTAVEVVDDTVIETQFSDDSGNVYKPDGTCATLVAGTYNEECYDKETNQDEADYSDLTALLAALHSNLRLTDPAAWREGLESVLNVDEFIDYLAVNTVVQNWDTYGVTNNNYYLYNDPETGLINLIPLDNNMALQSSANGSGGEGGDAPAGRDNQRAGGGGGSNRSAPSISLAEISDKFALIRYLMDDEVYAQQYAAAVEEVITDVFTVEKMTPIYDYYASLVEEYVKQEGGNQSVNQLNAAVEQLKSHVAERVSLAEEYLAGIQ